MTRFVYMFLLFMIYSCIGWILEVVGKLIENKRFINRGFLIGPYCPIYGFGVLIMISFLENYTHNVILLFVLSMFICMMLEYVTSYIMEKLFNARWWDYTRYKFNINGRICLETSIPFGLGGLLVMYVINPFLTNCLDNLSSEMVLIIGSILLVIFINDLVISFITILKIKNVDMSKFMDNTEEISKRVKEYLMENSVFTRRLINSFPDVNIKIKQIKDKLDELIIK